MKRILILIYTLILSVFSLISKKQLSAKITSTVIILSNVFALFGIYFFNWHPILLIILYWCEAVFIGVFNVFKIMLCGIYDKNNQTSIWNIRTSLIISIIFIITFGFFLIFYGLFILDLFSEQFFEKDVIRITEIWKYKFDLFSYIVPLKITRSKSILESELIAIIAIFISHSMVFFFNFVGEKKFIPAGPFHYLFKPYYRLFVIHMTVLLGGLVMDKIGWDNRIFINFWVFAKIIADQYIHNKGL